MNDELRTELKEKVKIAEEIAIEVKDKEMSLKAFEIVMAKLLESEATNTKKHTVRKSTLSTKKRVSNPNIEIKKSQLKFFEDQLLELKSFYDQFNESGRELTAFVLANFLKQKAQMELFNEADIEYCYQQLINQRTTTKPPVMNLDNIKQVLSWLTTPSRKKQWLEGAEGGSYKISAAGILQFKDLEERSKNANNKTATQ